MTQLQMEQNLEWPLQDQVEIMQYNYMGHLPNPSATATLIAHRKSIKKGPTEVEVELRAQGMPDLNQPIKITHGNKKLIEYALLLFENTEAATKK